MTTNKETIKVLTLPTLDELSIKIYNILFNKENLIPENSKELSEFLGDQEFINPSRDGWMLKFNEDGTMRIFIDNEELSFTYMDKELPGGFFLEQTITLGIYSYTKANWNQEEIIQIVKEEIYGWLRKCFIYSRYKIPE